jgi:hypothetical protein
MPRCSCNVTLSWNIKRVGSALRPKAQARRHALAGSAWLCYVSPQELKRRTGVAIFQADYAFAGIAAALFYAQRYF